MRKPEAATESQMARDKDATNLSRTFKYLMGQFKPRSFTFFSPSVFFYYAVVY